MKNTVSPPTAQRLKAAGFPQPEPESGQVWYEGQKAYVLGKIKQRQLHVRVDTPSMAAPNVLGKIKQRQLHGVYLDGECFEACDINAMHDDIFAPTATDILRELGNDYVLWFDHSPKMVVFFCAKTGNSIREAGAPFPNANPAEAAALAWLEIHEKKAFTPNARIRFNREQTIECYDENGKQSLLVIEKGKEYDAILKDMKATIKTVFGPVEFHLSNDDIVFIGWI